MVVELSTRFSVTEKLTYQTSLGQLYYNGYFLIMVKLKVAGCLLKVLSSHSLPSGQLSSIAS